MDKLKGRNDLTKQERNRLKILCKKLKHEEQTNKKEPKHTWDVIWSYVKSRDGGLTIVPRVHLSSNVGVVGLHTKIQTKSHFRPYEENFEVKCHPKEVVRNEEYDKHHYETFLKQPPFLLRQWRRGTGFLKRLISRKGN